MNACGRAGLALLAAAALAAGEWPPVSFTAARSAVSLLPERVNEAEGVSARYEAVELACERLQYLLRPLPPAGRATLAEAALTGGPDGRVWLDSRRSALPELPFRGLLRPRALLLERRDPPSAGAPVRLRVLAEDLGDVAGTVVTARGPRFHVAWAERAVIELDAEPAEGRLGLAPPRLVAIHLYGEGAAGSRPAVVLRLREEPAPEAASVAAQLGGGNVGMEARGRTMSLHFDSEGRLASYESDTGEFLVHDGDDIVPRLGAGPAPKP